MTMGKKELDSDEGKWSREILKTGRKRSWSEYS